MSWGCKGIVGYRMGCNPVDLGILASSSGCFRGTSPVGCSVWEMFEGDVIAEEECASCINPIVHAIPLQTRSLLWLPI